MGVTKQNAWTPTWNVGGKKGPRCGTRHAGNLHKAVRHVQMIGEPAVWVH